ncbi:MAG: sugar kinase [Chloroflexi bacterium]|nr:sugar kinase [Chloroflexota bacterium]
MSTSRKVVGFGELLLRLGTRQFQRFTQARAFEAYYTGAEANTCVSLVNFGMDAYVVSKVPAHDIGQACINFLKGHGLNTDYILRGGDRLGLFYLETGASQRASKVIYDRASSAFTTLKKGELDWKTILQGKDWFHFSGTAPALGPDMPEVVEEACQVAKQMGVTVSCDLNYRKKLWSPDKAGRVMTGLMAYVDVLLCNEEDAQMVFGIQAEGVDVRSGRLEAEKYQDVVRQLHRRFGCAHIAITLRESLSATFNNWSGVLYDGAQLYRSRSYSMYVVDRVGGGDSFGGGLIYGLLTGIPPQDVIEFAAAASCLKHSIPGDFNLASLEEVKALVAGDASGRVQR